MCESCNTDLFAGCGHEADDQPGGAEKAKGVDLVLTTAMEIGWPALESLGDQLDVDEPWRPKLAKSWDTGYDNFTMSLHLKQGVTSGEFSL